MRFYFESERIECIENRRYIIQFAGLPYIPNHKAGIESIKLFTERLMKSPLNEVSAILGGAYIIHMVLLQKS